ncbi:pyrokinin-1 receptor-like [Hetaerina americana]|uniref:pyrokinin-1 receptor-like n=1 Tax=Hetaerina americana TaxID=62018 RepID=UPI003A7F5176
MDSRLGGAGFFTNATAMEPVSIGSVLLNATPMALVDAVAAVGGRREDPSGVWDTSAAAAAVTTLDAHQTFSPSQGTSSPPQWVDGVRRRPPLYVIVPITIIYAIIFLSGIVGNVSTCIIIAKNKHMHTATNYYLFNLAISDLLLLVSGMPTEMYQTWSPYSYAFGEAFCVVQSFAAETSANATVLTITAFTVERYVAICHPLRSHTFSGLSRAVRLVVAAWVLAVCLAVPQAIQFGVIYSWDSAGERMDSEGAHCTVKRVLVQHAFAISTCVVFVAPMTVITALYVLIGLRLRNSRLIHRRSSAGSLRSEERKAGGKNSQNHVIKMLVAVVVAFFICWAPFHAQRLVAVYGKPEEEPTDMMLTAYYALTYISGILYYLSTTINPVLYHIMSLKFREAFKVTLGNHCGCIKTNSSHSNQSSRRGGSWQQLGNHRNRTCSTSTTQSERLSGGRLGRCPAEGQRTRLVTVRCSNATKSGDLHSHSYYFPGRDLPTKPPPLPPPTSRSLPPPSPDPRSKVELYDVSAEEVIVYMDGCERGPVEVVLLPSPRHHSPPSSPSAVTDDEVTVVPPRTGMSGGVPRGEHGAEDESLPVDESSPAETCGGVV